MIFQYFRMRKLYLFCLTVLCLGLDAKAVDYENWMRELSDDLMISQLSIPGTHDSGTAGFMFCGETQKLDIQSQLNCGVRAFDIRAGIRNDSTLLVFHSALLHGCGIDMVFQTLTDFLAAHPSECLFVVLKRECGDEDTWNNLIRDCLHKYEDFFADLDHNLTIGQIRGKILLMSRNRYADSPFGTFFLSKWSDNATSDNYIKGTGSYQMPVRIQDIYNAEGKLEEKKADIIRLLDESAAATGRLFINHTSGYTYTYYFDSRAIAACAEACNATVIQYLQDSKGPAGIIMADFAGVEQLEYGGENYNVGGQQLIDCIISHCCKVGEILYPSAVYFTTRQEDTRTLPLFDMQGRQLECVPQNGIYIRSGHKYITGRKY